MEYSNELYHHGVKGQRWGIRRFQNKDGSLTNAGRKRRAKLEAELKQLDGKKGSDGDGATKPKSVSEMSNKELQEYTTRMQLEKNYYDAQRNLNNMQPKQVSKGKQMVEKFLSDSVLPAVSNATKSYLESYMKKKLGLEEKDELSTLKKTFDMLDYKQRIDKLNNPDKYMSWDDKTKQYDLERKRKTDAEKDAAAAAEKAKKAVEEAKDAAQAERANRLNAQKDVQSRIKSGSSVNEFINRVVTPATSRPAVKNAIGDAIVAKDQVYLSNGKSSNSVDRGKSFVDDIVSDDGRDDD